jgi:YVTN family beta-propeller protein
VEGRLGNDRAGTVYEIDPNLLTPHKVRVRGTASDVANVGDLAAVVSGPPEQVTMVDAQFGQISSVVDVPGARVPGTAVAFGRDVWVVNPSGYRLELLDPPYTAITMSVPLPGVPRLVAAGEGAVWAVGGRTLCRVDRVRADSSRGSLSRLLLKQLTRARAACGWPTGAGTPSSVSILPSGHPMQRINVGHPPTAIAVGADSVWVANRADGTVSRIDPRRNAVEKTIRVGAEPIDLVAGLGAVWVVRRTG